ncbi:MAG: 50S ribosome-binding GTPase [Eubacteriales bacterium]|nr:50S ribosome-binding GTPase [Eubacteriales bacterium]
MVSSGKSSLYNVLINRMDEYFPTGAARTTTRADYFDYNHISYVDTPGIDVRSEDDALAFSTLIESDIIVMVHNIRTGPLNRNEVEWLKRITRSMSSIEMCKARILFVASWKDTREKDSDYKKLIGSLKQQAFEAVGCEIPFFEVSVKKYQQGIKKGKEVLVNNSGILEFKNYLEEYAAVYLEKKRALDEREMQALLLEVMGILQNVRNQKMQEVDKIYDQVCSIYKSRSNAWKQVYDFFAAQRQKLAGLEKELNNI